MYVSVIKYASKYFKNVINLFKMGKQINSVNKNTNYLLEDDSKYCFTLSECNSEEKKW